MYHYLIFVSVFKYNLFYFNNYMFRKEQFEYEYALFLHRLVFLPFKSIV